MAERLSILEQDKRPAVRSTSELGSLGERLAAEYLEQVGYRLVLKNFKVPIGRNSRGASVTGEIDIVALDEAVLCFVEVKAKRSAGFAHPLASVTLAKQRQITRTSRIYRRIFGLQDMPFRFDVVSVVTVRDKAPDILLVKSFWSEGRFRKKRWSGDIY